MDGTLKYHDDCGQRELSSLYPARVDINLIDIRRMCLIRAATTFKYIALSYVWVQVPQLKTTSSNLTTLLKPNSLTQFENEISVVIKDAINLAARLNASYLWVDTLCIVQDDALIKHQQISLMAEIYNSATLTIIACTGSHANTPLSDYLSKLCIENSGREGKNMVWRPLDSRALVTNINSSCYGRRAWTYQERLLSRRRVHFTASEIVFQCREDLWSENGTEEVTVKMGPYSETDYHFRSTVYLENPPSPTWELQEAGESFFQCGEGWPEMGTEEVTLITGPYSKTDYPENSPPPDKQEVDEQERPVRKKGNRLWGEGFREWPVDMKRDSWDLGFGFWSSVVSEYSRKQLTFQSDILAACAGIFCAFEGYSDWRLLCGLPEPIFDIALLWVPLKDHHASSFED
jgi:hypothetical protein